MIEVVSERQIKSLVESLICSLKLIEKNVKRNNVVKENEFIYNIKKNL